MGNLAERNTGDAVAELGIEPLLERYFEQLMRWGMILTRGDVDLAEEVVQDLCVYLALSSPDMSGVANQDGYLYTSLRNMYVSRQARASRERTRVVSIADLESVQTVLTCHGSEDLLDRQNQILQICSFLNWRKETSKSASYLILLFFHGYERSEVARIALVPVATIYNKLRTARVEIRDHLDALRKLRIVPKNGPPQIQLLSSPMSSAAFFMELRKMIFHSRSSGCLPQEKLLELYRAPANSPIPCGVLAHIVGCERCLSVVDRHYEFPSSDDRGPLGGPNSFVGEARQSPGTRDRCQAMLRVIRKRLEQIHEHRPGQIALAVNGNITTSYEIRGERSSLTVSVDDSADLHFIEVFSDHQHRLAQLSADGLGHASRSQRISLSDDRWLELTLWRDGRSIRAEAVYYDPSLAYAAEAVPSGTPAAIKPVSDRPIGNVQLSIRKRLVSFLSAPSLAWCCIVVGIVGVGGYMMNRLAHSRLSATNILSRAVATDGILPANETEHQVVAIEEFTAAGANIPLGRIELWRQGDGRHLVRRMFDTTDQLLASEYQNEGHPPVTVVSEHEQDAPATDQVLIGSGLWKRDISARAFQQSARDPQAIGTTGGYELSGSAMNDAGPQLVSATLVLDRGFHLKEERIAFVHRGSRTQVRFVQTEYKTIPNRSVPDSVFGPERPSSPNALSSAHGVSPTSSQAALADAGRVEIDALYQLSQMGADTNEPIAVAATSDGRVRITGAVSNKERLAQIEASLQPLEHENLIEDDLTSSSSTAEVRPHKTGNAPVIDIYQANSTTPPALEMLRQHFRGEGMTDQAANDAALQFSAEVLQTAEQALQNAYALDRLGSILSKENHPLDASSQREWVQMVGKHAGDLQTHLLALRAQLGLLEPSNGAAAKEEPSEDLVQNAMEFAEITAKLRESMQAVNADVGAIFTSEPSHQAVSDHTAELTNLLQSLPLNSAAELKNFAERLAGAQVSTAERSAPAPESRR